MRTEQNLDSYLLAVTLVGLMVTIGVSISAAAVWVLWERLVSLVGLLVGG